MKFTILRFDSIGSTNTEALKQAKWARPKVCASSREGRPPDADDTVETGFPSGMPGFFSIVLRPVIETRFLPLITLMTAVAVFDSLVELYELKPDIKWANDIYVADRKIGGVLAEMSEANKNLSVVVGIGVNIKSTDFPPELGEIAASIEEETRRKIDGEELFENLTGKNIFFYEILQGKDGAAKICGEWTTRSSYAFGKNVRVRLANETFTGTTRGIEENGALRVETENGETKIVQAGDVERLRKT